VAYPYPLHDRSHVLPFSTGQNEKLALVCIQLPLRNKTFPADLMPLGRSRRDGEVSFKADKAGFQLHCAFQY
jgi:hypothetical protein